MGDAKNPICDHTRVVYLVERPPIATLANPTVTCSIDPWLANNVRVVGHTILVPRFDTSSAVVDKSSRPTILPAESSR